MEQPNTSHFKLSATSCGTCAVHFDNPDTRRAHSRSQWHVTNLKRRMADLEPLTAEQHAASVSTQSAVPPAGGPTTESDSSSSSASDADLSDAEDDDDDYIPEECLFCNTTSDSLDGNVAHMHKAHGMFIPDKEKLIVDVETLVKYLHLVVFGYRECLQCGTQRRTAAAVQQHMLGKGHCRFDVTAEDSEFRDFYEQSSDDGENTGKEGNARKAIADALEEGGSIRLPSGKQLSHRSAPGPSRPRTRIGASNDTATSENIIQEGSGSSGINESEASFQLTAPSGPGGKFDTKALTRAEKRDVVFEAQLSRLSINDRSALAHLSSAEQRSVLSTRQKQLGKAEKAARRLQTRLEMKANKTGQGNFVNDVPGRKNG
ncbi:hypothetical protein CSAL01_09427 [Colletotrichum salicis]|uniref:ZN622/Rei1/Reh1 zinc finger C2H2-type domain-containing protein n=1 Tax=Colletotrichum salicis TaxID=1209931 RepID=A0A135U5L4_9PEZI|nr:hypothetical protein CSAL01_09427 [Colletotrichum salicis]